MKYKIYLWFVNQRDRNHYSDGFTLWGTICQFILNQRWFWIRKNNNDNENQKEI